MVAQDSSITRWYFFSFAMVSLIDDFEMALITSVNVAHVANSDVMCSLTASGSKWWTSRMRRPVGSEILFMNINIFFFFLSNLLCYQDKVLWYTCAVVLNQDVGFENINWFLSQTTPELHPPLMWQQRKSGPMCPPLFLGSSFLVINRCLLC